MPRRNIFGLFKISFLSTSSTRVKTMLRSHSVLGLTLGFLLYVICVTGTFSVFYPNFERWEQPAVKEFTAIESDSLDRAIAQLAQRTALDNNKRIVISMPTDHLPRASISHGEQAYFIDEKGNLGDAVNHEWTHFLVALHYALNLPNIIGLSLVGTLGVMLLAMVISGLLAHPNIFRDAFSLRLNRSKRLQQVDLHNRLSVWTIPMQIMLALTGAFIGLSQVLVFVFANVFYDGDTEEAGHLIFGHEAKATNVQAPLVEVSPILEIFQQQHPEFKPLSLRVHFPGTTGQEVEISALVPKRLVWAEYFHYQANGELIEKAGWSDGSVGQQLYASTYRLHFGHFAGLPLQFVYLAFGIAICLSIITGINIWLLSRRKKGNAAIHIEKLWRGTIWGTLIAIAISSIGYQLLGGFAVPLFWVTLSSLLIYSRVARLNNGQLSAYFRLTMAGTAALVVIVHVVVHGKASLYNSALLINCLWAGLSLSSMAWYIFVDRRVQSIDTRALKPTANEPA